jgi:hypothetical protein
MDNNSNSLAQSCALLSGDGSITQSDTHTHTHSLVLQVHHDMMGRAERTVRPSSAVAAIE